MSNDLISRQYLLDIATAEGAYDYVSAHDVANAPTAYDVDKVIERLEMLRNVSDTGKAYLQEIIDSPLELREIVRESVINNAIKIVRNGGKND